MWATGLRSADCSRRTEGGGEILTHSVVLSDQCSARVAYGWGVLLAVHSAIWLLIGFSRANPSFIT